jgi:hypothetical protein
MSACRTGREPTDEIGTAINCRAKSRGRTSSETADNEQIPKSHGWGSGSDDETVSAGSEHREGWLMTPDKCHEPAYPMSDIGLAGGGAPSTPRTALQRLAPVPIPPSKRPSLGRSLGRRMSAGTPGVRQSTVTRSRQPAPQAPQVLRSAPALSG